MALSRAGKTDRPVDLSVDQGRRQFLLRCGLGASAAFVPASLRTFALSPGYLDSLNALVPDAEFHLRPHYRARLPLEAMLLKTKPGLDQFVTEKYADQVAVTFLEWSASLRRSPQDTRTFENSLAETFAGASLTPLASQILRASPALEVRRNQFATQANLNPDAFLNDLRSTLNGFVEISLADFQVIGIEAIPSTHPARLQTRVRYELVGSGRNFYREQRVGEWLMEWDSASGTNLTGHFRVRSWRALAETHSRSFAPVFLDITAEAFGSNPSYSAQLLHGSDYWRTLLDQACGIDIYGHNGVAVGDIDGDGFDDIYVCQPSGLPNRLYRNRGNGTFDDITEASGLGVLENTACALFADFNNDGRQDLIVVRTDGPVLYRNQGAGKFRKQPDAFHFANPPQGTFTGAAIADYDRDGYLDIYFCLYLYYQGADQYQYPSPYFDAENGPPNFLMKNNRDGTFRDVTAQSGLNQNNRRFSFCCGWNDYNRDGWPDLYVVNDFGRKNLYRNNGDGTFTDVAAELGVEDVGAGMSVCWLDYDNDGLDDLYVANMWTAAGMRVTTQQVFQSEVSENVRALYRKHSMGNSLLRNDAAKNNNPVFENVSGPAGVEMGRWSWSSDAWDFDHDGFPDLYIANGMVSGPSRSDLNSFFWRQVVANSPAQAKPSTDYEQAWNALNDLIRSDGTWSGYERNVFYANNRDGTFSDVSAVVGMDFVEDGRSFALADFDHDGRPEVLLKNRNAPQLRLLKNVIQDLPPSIAFRLHGSKSNRDAIGAAVTVETEFGRQTRMLQAGSGFLAQHTKEVFFGLGDTKGPVRASIRWPSGQVQDLRDLPLNHRICIEEGAAPSRMEPFTKAPARGDGPAREPQPAETIPNIIETWLLAPVTAPDFALPDRSGKIRMLSALQGQPVLLNFSTSASADSRQALEGFERHHQRWAAEGLHLLALQVDDLSDGDRLREPARQPQFSFPIVRATDDVAGIYNILYRYLFDRHRDLSLPTSFLINPNGEIVKIYQGPVRPEQVEDDFRHIPRTAAQRSAKGLPFPGSMDAPDFQRNYLSYGSVFFQREYFDQAESSFQLALRDDPSSAEALYGLGSVYLKQQKRTEARDSFERATRMQSAYPETLPNAWNNLGLIATQDGRTDEAIAYFQQALRLSPDHLIALDNLGNAYRQQKRWSEARDVLQRALAAHPQDPEANYSLGMVYAQTDDTGHAYEYLQKALQFRPGYPEALNNLGVLYLRTGRRADAVASFEECIRAAPGFDQSYLNLAKLHALDGKPEKARTVLRELLKQHPDHVQAQQALAELGQ